ncbi:hypothetical protein [Mycobacterium avium]|uniref:hypothetical protein n=1 Tax=Mycobacterium avium TaxID=1764 RepID=UPI001155DDC4|nr:hypothetical protein [Mycobacterium avium]
MGTYRYTAIPVKDMPYPAGLGKAEYDALEFGMRRLLGRSWDHQATNERLFWTPEYQNLISTHLKPMFDEHGDIVTNATLAVDVASTSHAFDTAITAVSSCEANAEYRDALPHITDLMDRYGAKTAWWIIRPPRIWWDGTALGFADGRHRLSYLRSLVQQQHPDFRVLVELGS